MSYSELDSTLNIIEQDALPTNYYDEIIAITSVARYSYTYWEQNLDDWIFTFSGGYKSVNVDPRFWDIIGEDVKGAVGGALGGGIVGALIGAPVMSGIEGIIICLQSK